jgi:hypothetical protein
MAAIISGADKIRNNGVGSTGFGMWGFAAEFKVCAGREENQQVETCSS